MFSTEFKGQDGTAAEVHVLLSHVCHALPCQGQMSKGPIAGGYWPPTPKRLFQCKSTQWLEPHQEVEGNESKAISNKVHGFTSICRSKCTDLQCETTGSF